VREKYRVQDNLYNIKPHGKKKKKQSTTNITSKSRPLSVLYKRRKFLLLKIKNLENKIIFTNSKSLKTLCYNLKEQDLNILCQINRSLLSIK